MKLNLKGRWKELIQKVRIRRIEERKPLLSKFSNHTICIFSNPRGGSTWLSEMINSSGPFITLHEPLFQGRFRTDGVMPSGVRGRDYLRKLKYWYYQPINESNELETDRIFFRKLFSGKYLDPNLTVYSTADQLELYDQILVKFCYGNLMLPWLTENFDIAAIFLLRNPYAIISSQLKVDGAFVHILNHPEFKLPNFRGAEYFNQFQPILKRIKRPEENLAAIWAITTKHLLNHANNNRKWLTVQYESLLQDPESTITKIKNTFPGFRWNTELPDTQIPSRSSTDKNLKMHLNNGTQLTKWRGELTKSQIANIQALLKDFEIDIDYSDQIF